MNDVSKIRRMDWFPVKEGRDLHLLNLVHKALYSPNWPTYVVCNLEHIRIVYVFIQIRI